MEYPPIYSLLRCNLITIVKFWNELEKCNKISQKFGTMEKNVTIQRIVFNDDFWINQQETIEICFKNDKEKTFLTHFLKNYPISIPRNAVYGLFAEQLQKNVYFCSQIQTNITV